MSTQKPLAAALFHVSLASSITWIALAPVLNWVLLPQVNLFMHPYGSQASELEWVVSEDKLGGAPRKFNSLIYITPGALIWSYTVDCVKRMYT